MSVTQRMTLKDINGFPSTYQGFRITFNPYFDSQSDVPFEHLKIVAKSSDGQEIQGDTWDELKAKIDAARRD